MVVLDVRFEKIDPKQRHHFFNEQYLYNIVTVRFETRKYTRSCIN